MPLRIHEVEENTRQGSTPSYAGAVYGATASRVSTTVLTSRTTAVSSGTAGHLAVDQQVDIHRTTAQLWVAQLSNALPSVMLGLSLLVTPHSC
jgi:hypothetical protein